MLGFVRMKCVYKLIIDWFWVANNDSSVPVHINYILIKTTFNRKRIEGHTPLIYYINSIRFKSPMVYFINASISLLSINDAFIFSIVDGGIICL